MRVTWILMGFGALSACTGQMINAGSDDGGGSTNATTSASTSTGAGTTPSADGGPAVIASEIQLTPTNMVSDGTSLFWVSGVDTGGPASSMSINGGTINTVVPGPIGGGTIAVDQANFYYLGAGGIVSAPKGGGGSPSLVNEPIDAATTSIESFTVLGSNAYWLEVAPGTGNNLTDDYAVKSGALLGGGSITTLFTFEQSGPGGFGIGVSSSTVFVNESSGLGQLYPFPIEQTIADGGLPTPVAGLPFDGCQSLISDSAAVVCETLGSILGIADDGTVTTLGTVVLNGQTGGNVAVDDTYVYWLDSTTVGTVMRAPKTGGSATVIARDTQPVAIAVDSNAVYWSDQGGNIMKLAK